MLFILPLFLSHFIYFGRIMPKTPKLSENYSPIFQNRIISIMDDLEMNQKQFAAFVQVSQPVINRAVKYGIIPSVRILIKIADCLNYSLAYLLGKTDKKEFYKSGTPTTYHIRVIELKEEKHVKFGQIAQKTNIPKEYFYEWQRLKTLPSLDFLKQIASYFKVSLDYLTGRSDDKVN